MNQSNPSEIYIHCFHSFGSLRFQLTIFLLLGIEGTSVKIHLALFTVFRAIFFIFKIMMKSITKKLQILQETSYIESMALSSQNFEVEFVILTPSISKSIKLCFCTDPTCLCDLWGSRFMTLRISLTTEMMTWAK